MIGWYSAVVFQGLIESAMACKTRESSNHQTISVPIEMMTGHFQLVGPNPMQETIHNDVFMDAENHPVLKQMQH